MSAERLGRRLLRLGVKPFEAALDAAGLELRRRCEADEAPPPLAGDPIEALHLARAGARVAFDCPLDLCVAYNGFRYGEEGWHPFVAALRELASGREGGFEGSVLEAFFARWRPEHAAAAMTMRSGGPAPPALAALPGYAFLFPWVSTTPRERLDAVHSIIRSENRRHGSEKLSVEDGYNQHGPVSRRKGEIELERLRHCYRALRPDGWDRRFGDATVTILRRAGEARYLVMHGHHRAAAATALGHRSIPARLGTPAAADLDDAPDWPQVRRGIWPEESARAYLEHLFDFDPRAWARARELTPADGPGGPLSRAGSKIAPAP